jgi:hypothetical protein
VTPCYFALDCIPGADGQIRVVDVHGSVGSGLTTLASAYGGAPAARARLKPYLQRLAELAAGKLILFVHDPFRPRPTFPDSFFDLAQRYAAFCPITDWVPDEIGMFLEPLAGRLRARLGYCAAARVDYQGGQPKVLLSGYRDRARRPPKTVILSPEDIGVVVFSGASDRFPDDLKSQSWFVNVNPPLLDRALEHKWLLPTLLEGTSAASRLPRSLPVGLGFRTAAEITEFTGALHGPNGFPVAVMKPSHTSLSPGVRFLDRTALRALALRQPERRLPAPEGEKLLAPRIEHTYEEVSGYRGKLLDNMLRTPGARVHDHRDGTFHFSAPYPFLECTVSTLQEYVEARPLRSRRTGKLHRGSLRVVIFDRKIVAAVYRLGHEVDDGTFRDLTRPGVRVFHEGASPEEEAGIAWQLLPFAEELERRIQQRVRSDADLDALRRAWVQRQTTDA